MASVCCSLADARGFWIAAPGEGAIRPTTLLPANQDQVTVRTLYSSVSAGTERLVFEGRVPPSQYQVMRAPFQEGVFPGPVLYGYSNVGMAENGPATIRGRTVFTLYPHVDRFTVPADMVAIIPDTVPPARAVLAANMETALNAIWDLEPRIGDRVAVIGGGVVGCLAAWFASRVTGSPATLIDIDPARQTIAGQLGLEFALTQTVSTEFDRIVHASGQPDGLVTALQIAAFEARVIELSWYGDKEVTLPLGENFHSRRLTIQSSQVGHVAAPMRHRLTHQDRLQLALAELADPLLENLIDHEIVFEALPDFFRALAAGDIKPLCTRVTYTPEDSPHV